MKKLFREPLLHFLVLGGLIFALYSAMAQKGAGENEIFITRGQQENLLNTFSRTWQRMPTAVEYQGLMRDYIRQEIAYRESREMGLDQDDIVIRRRLRQKMEMLAEDVAGLVPPTAQELQEYLDDHPEQFTFEPRLTLHHVYFSADRRGTDAQRDALAVLSVLEGQGDTADTASVGDPLPLPAFIEDAPESEIARLFGGVFVDGLRGVPADRWAGPVKSGFGLHLVFVTGRVDARVPELAEVRAEVERELMSRRRTEAVDGLYDKLAENYTIEIEPLIDAENTEEVAGQ